MHDCFKMRIRWRAFVAAMSALALMASPALGQASGDARRTTEVVLWPSGFTEPILESLAEGVDHLALLPEKKAIVVRGTRDHVLRFKERLDELTTKLKNAAAREEILVVQFRHLLASEAASVLASVDGSGVRLAPHGPNRLVLRGTPEQLEAAQRILVELDVPEEGKEAAPRSLRLYALKFAEAETAFRLVEAQLSGERGVRAMVDNRTNGVVVQAPEALHAKVRALLEKIDVDRRVDRGPKALTMQVLRVLARRGGEEDTDRPPPAFLSGIEVLVEQAPQFARHAVMAGLVQLTVSENSEWTARGAAFAGDRFQVQGLVEPASSSRYQSSLTVEDGSGADGASLSTKVTIPLDHTVILGVTPTGGIQTAYLIRLSSAGDGPAEKGAGKARN